MLDERKSAILSAVIEEYIETAQPVGSSFVVQAARVSVSSATVRNDMVSLESDGYLHQPHTSAGRVPTDKGYRHFVDSLDIGNSLNQDQFGISNFFRHMQGEIEQVLQNTAGLLVNMTDYAAVVVDQVDDSAPVRSVQLVSLAERVALVVAVLGDGQVHKLTIEPETVTTQNDLDMINPLVRAASEDRPLSKPRTVDQIDLATLNASQQVLVNLILSGLGRQPKEAEKVYVNGTSHVATAFDAVESVREVLSILEQQLVVVTLLADVTDRGLSVVIGAETGVGPLSDCSLVVSPYEVDGEAAGSIAVLGPTRMNYPQAMSAVAVVSNALGRRLSEGQ